MYADHRPVDVGNVLLDVPQQLGELGRDGVTHGIRYVYRSRAGIYYRLDELVKVLGVGPGGVHGRELDVVAVAPGPAYHGHRHVHHFLPVLADLVRQVDIRAGEEDVDTGILSAFKGLPRLVHVCRMGAGQRGDDRAFDLPSDGLNRLEVPGRAGGKSRLYDVYPQAGELPGDLQLLFAGHAYARGLLAIPERRVEYCYSLLGHDLTPSGLNFHWISVRPALS